MTYTDLHLHLLPGVDDGPADEAESLEHAKRLVREGVCEATVTPHVGHPSFPLEIASIEARTRTLQAALDREGIALKIHPGGEIHPSAAGWLAREDLALVAHGPRAARWVLVEVPFSGIDSAWIDGVRSIRSCGFEVVIAHPERAEGLLEQGLDRLRCELASGAVLQVNVCSLLGHNGLEAQLAAEELVRSGLAYILASDGHGGRRRHTLRLGFDLALAAGASSVQAWRLTQANPRFLLRHGLPRTPARMPDPSHERRAQGADRGGDERRAQGAHRARDERLVEAVRARLLS